MKNKQKIVQLSLLCSAFFVVFPFYWANTVLKKVDPIQSSTQVSAKAPSWANDASERRETIQSLEAVHNLCRRFYLHKCAYRSLAAAAEVAAMGGDFSSLSLAKSFHLRAIEEARSLSDNPDVGDGEDLDPRDPLSVAKDKFKVFCEKHASALMPMKKRELVKKVARELVRELVPNQPAQPKKNKLSIDENNLVRKTKRRKKKTAIAVRKKSSSGRNGTPSAEPRISLGSENRNVSQMSQKEKLQREIARLKEIRDVQKDLLEGARRKSLDRLAKLKKIRKKKIQEIKRIATKRKKIELLRSKKVKREKYGEDNENPTSIDDIDPDYFAEERPKRERVSSKKKAVNILDSKGRIKTVELEEEKSSKKSDPVDESNGESVEEELARLRLKRRAIRHAKVITNFGR